VAVVNGDATISNHLLSFPFDHIHFTGSTKVGKIIMAKAAENLSSCTLELGGKSPVIIDDKCDLDAMAKKLIFGKFVNAGQTCIAPDYVLVPNNRKNDCIAAIRKAILDAFGETIQQNDNLSRIINIANHQRVVQLLKDAKLAGANIVFGGNYDVSDLYIEPTVITDIPEDQPLLQEEIFGPILPIISFDTVKDAVSFIKKRPKPLAMYLFTNQNKWLEYFKIKTSAGALVVNDVLVHMMHPNLPFGGINHSGIGQSTGWYGLKDFSHQKPILESSKLLSSTSKIGFPYKSKIEKLLKFLI